MKTIYSLKEFNEIVCEIAKSINETWFAVSVQIMNGKFIFGCYVHKYEWYNGETMEESIGKLKSAVFPPTAALTLNIDVEIDMEIPEPVNS